MSDVQTIKITIDDLINGNLRDMEITAQFGVYRQAVKGLDEQLKAKEQECESWKALIDEAQIEQRKLEQQLEAYKMEAEEGREINAELKAENEKLKVWKSITPLKTKMLVKALTEIKQLLEDALDTDKTNAEQSFDNIHKAIKLCEVLDE